MKINEEGRTEQDVKDCAKRKTEKEMRIIIILDERNLKKLETANKRIFSDHKCF